MWDGKFNLPILEKLAAIFFVKLQVWFLRRYSWKFVIFVARISVVFQQ